MRPQGRAYAKFLRLFNITTDVPALCIDGREYRRRRRRR